MKQGVIFDMDGTLWDSAKEVAEAWNLAMRQCKYERAPLNADDMYRVMGKTMEDIARLLFSDVQGERQKEILDVCCRVENDYLREHGGMLYPKLRETLDTLRESYHLYIVSNCQSGYIEAFLDHYDLRSRIEDFQCYGDNRRPKADNIRILCERNHLDDAVYVGDIQGDYDSSMAAGVKFIHAAYGFGTINAAVPRIETLAKLPELVPTVLG